MGNVVEHVCGGGAEGGLMGQGRHVDGTAGHVESMGRNMLYAM